MLVPKRKVFLIVILGVLVTAVVAVIFFSDKSINQWRARRYAERGAALVRSGNIEEARTAFLNALTLDRECLPAMRELVALSPQGDTENALLLSARIADIDPSDRDNLERLAYFALRVSRLNMTATALRDLERDEGATPRVLKLRTSLALASGDDAGTVAAARQMLEHEPQNVPVRLAAALAEVRSGKTTDETERDLTALSEKDGVRLEALRGLRNLAQQKTDRKKTIECAEAVTKVPQAGFADWMLYADLVAAENPGRADDLIQDLTTRAGSDPRALGAIASWLRKLGRADTIKAWIDSNEALKRDPTAAQMIRADDLMARNEWVELDTLLAGEKWDNMDFIRQAALARSARARGKNEEGAKYWREASDAAMGGLGTARMLVELTGGWPQLREQTDSFLWVASEHGPEYAVWALAALQGRASEAGDTHNLLRIAKAMQRLRPDSDQVRNNLAYYSLLLNVGTAAANQTISELFSKYPTDPVIVSTYALSLLRREHNSEALAAMEKLPVADRESAQMAPYYALALAKIGNMQRANEVLAHARREKLLPEEEALLKQAKL